jgi:hypothetical protein
MGEFMKNTQEPIHYKHEVVVYVPYFLQNDPLEFPYYPTFVWSMENATSDEQMAWSMEPYGVFELKGTFDATTPPALDYLTEHGNGD